MLLEVATAVAVQRRGYWGTGSPGECRGRLPRPHLLGESSFDDSGLADTGVTPIEYPGCSACPGRLAPRPVRRCRQVVTGWSPVLGLANMGWAITRGGRRRTWAVPSQNRSNGQGMGCDRQINSVQAATPKHIRANVNNGAPVRMLRALKPQNDRTLVTPHYAWPFNPPLTLVALLHRFR